MTREEIEAMPAGREMDAETHRRVMGMETKFVNAWVFGSGDWCETISISLDAAGNEIPQPIPHYSTDIAAAWQVVERLHLGVIRFNGQWVAGYSLPGCHIRRPQLVTHAVADTAPLAVCRAALIATTATPSSPQPRPPA